MADAMKEAKMASDQSGLASQWAALRHVAPSMAGELETRILGDLWARPGLAPRDRGLITLAAMIAQARAGEVSFYGARALDLGLTPAQIDEMLLQLAVYCGWPVAVQAALELAPLYAERGIGPVACPQQALIDLEAGAEAARRDAVARTVAPTAPNLAADTDDFLFGEVWRRPGLSARDRSLVTMVALVSIGQSEQLPFHANRAMDNGLGEAEAGEVLAHLAYYVGWPRTMSAVGVLRTIIATRKGA